MDYKKTFEIAEKLIVEHMANHKKWPLSGYNDQAAGVLSMWHTCALQYTYLTDEDHSHLSNLIYEGS